MRDYTSTLSHPVLSFRERWKIAPFCHWLSHQSQWSWWPGLEWRTGRGQYSGAHNCTHCCRNLVSCHHQASLYYKQIIWPKELFPLAFQLYCDWTHRYIISSLIILLWQCSPWPTNNILSHNTNYIEIRGLHKSLGPKYILECTLWQ